jgi:hypothetical protein
MDRLWMLENNQPTPIHLERCLLRRDKDANRNAKLRFAVELTTEIAITSPPQIRAAFEAIATRENKIVEVTSGPEIENIGIEFYPLPSKFNCSLALRSVSLVDFTVEDRDGKPFVCFSINLKLDDKTELRHWIVDSIFTSLWASFEVLQMALLPTSSKPPGDHAVN